MSTRFRKLLTAKHRKTRPEPIHVDENHGFYVNSGIAKPMLVLVKGYENLYSHYEIPKIIVGSHDAMLALKAITDDSMINR